MSEPIRQIDAPISWRDVFILHINDMDLRAKVESFLTFFESTGFKFAHLNVTTGAVTAHEHSGQDIVGMCKEWLDAVTDANLIPTLEHNGWAPKGKFLIMQNDQTYDSQSPSTRCGTLFMGSKQSGPMPVMIMLNTSYLKGARYQDLDGNLHPVTVDAVLTNALTSFAFRDPQSKLPLEVETVVIAALGGAQPETSIETLFAPNINRGYQTLHSVVTRSPLGTAFDASVDGYDSGDAGDQPPAGAAPTGTGNDPNGRTPQ